MIHTRTFIIALLTLLMRLPALKADTVVTTYVTKIQKERRSLRWTLTEWLRIKERMRMMDLWLAMFSRPKTDKFSPEINLIYFQSRGELSYSATAENGVQESAPITAHQGRLQLYLTNIVTATTKLRTLNVDFGLEAGGKQTSRFSPQASSSFETEISLEERRSRSNYYAANFRLFGKNIQDSSLVAKIGNYTVDNRILRAADFEGGAKASGLLTAAELQLYLFRWLGVEGNYYWFNRTPVGQAGEYVVGSYYDYFGYIEISLLRVMFGLYTETWQFGDGIHEVNLADTGYIGGIKLQI